MHGVGRAGDVRAGHAAQARDVVKRHAREPPVGLSRAEGRRIAATHDLHSLAGRARRPSGAPVVPEVTTIAASPGAAGTPSGEPSPAVAVVEVRRAQLLDEPPVLRRRQAGIDGHDDLAGVPRPDHDPGERRARQGREHDVRSVGGGHGP